MMRGWVGFLDITENKGRVPIGWNVISWVSNSTIIHTFLLFEEPGSLEDWPVYETSESFYMKRTLKERMSGCKAHFFPIVGDEIKARNYCEEHLGAPYDYPGIAGLGVMLLAERVLNWMVWPLKFLLQETPSVTFVGNPLHLERAYFCSEIAIGACRASGMKLPGWWTNQSIAPHQFYQWLIDFGHQEDKIW